jgi:cytochrome c-type biogenesis protein
MTDLVTVSMGLAFLAGMASFLSPCVFPVVPSYVGFVTGVTLDELKDGGRAAARRRAAVHSALFVLGFSLVFIALGASATALGGTLRRSLPLLQPLGGVVIVIFGLYLLGALKIPALMRERRMQLTSKPAGHLGSVVVGVAFGAGWTPNWFLAGASRLRRWIVPLERAAGVMLVLVGVLLFTGEFARITAFLAQFTPAIEIGL